MPKFVFLVLCSVLASSAFAESSADAAALEIAEYWVAVIQIGTAVIGIMVGIDAIRAVRAALMG